MPFTFQGFGKIPHGTEKPDHFLDMMFYIIRFLPHFGHKVYMVIIYLI